MRITHKAKMRSAGMLALLMLASVAAKAQSPLLLHWDTNGVAIGQQAEVLLGDQLRLVVECPLEQAAAMPHFSLGDVTQGDVQALAMTVDTLRTPSGDRERQLFTVACFRPGLYRVGLPTVADSLTLLVSDLLADDTAQVQLRDIAPPFKVPLTFWEVARYPLLLLLVAALVCCGVYLAQRLKNHQPILPRPVEPSVPPKQEALSALEQLRQRELWQQGRLKDYYTELTDIVRHYLNRRYAIESVEMTSEQTLEAFDGCRGYTADRAAWLRQLLSAADMVKFAKAEPLPHEHDLSMNNALRFVQAEEEEEVQP